MKKKEKKKEKEEKSTRGIKSKPKEALFISALHPFDSSPPPEPK